MQATTSTDALLREVARLYVQAQLNTAACCDISSQTQCKVITELGRNQPLTPQQLGDALGFEKSWMSRVINQLVNEGFIEKYPNQDDGRSYLLELTDAGQIRFSQLNETLNHHAERVMEHIPEQEREGVQHALMLLRDALRAEALEPMEPICSP